MSSDGPTGNDMSAAAIQRVRNRKSGHCVALVGADGSGKSTVMRRLRASGMDLVCVKTGLGSKSFNRLPKLGRLVRRAESAGRLVVTTRLSMWRGKILLWDRHPVEDFWTVAESRSVLRRGQGWARVLLPAPDLLIVLDAPARVLHARRQEQDRATLERLRHCYLRMAAAAPNALIIDASRPMECVYQEVLQALDCEGIG
jgi:thymidylate kinase